MRKLHLLSAILTTITALAFAESHSAYGQDTPLPYSRIIDTMMRLCIGRTHTINITATSANTDGTIIGEEIITEPTLLITPDQKVILTDKNIETSTIERREVTLPNGDKIT